MAQKSSRVKDVPKNSVQDLLKRVDPRVLPLRYQIGVLGILGMLLIPTALTPIQLIGMVTIVYLMMYAMSWDLVSGYTGQVSLGHTMFLAIGGYGTAVLNLQHGVHPALSIPISVGLAALVGLLIGIPALRLRGPYLSLVTLIIPLIMLQLVILFSNKLPLLAPDGLKGSSGFIEAPAPVFGTFNRAVVTLDSYRQVVIGDYYLAVSFFLLTLVVLLAITRSDAGSVFTAIRENEDVVGSVGLTPAKYKLFAFVLSGAVAGLAGAGLVHSVAGQPLPRLLLSLRRSLMVIVMGVLGGLGTIVGGAVGAAFFVLFNQLLGSVPFQVPIINQTLGAMEPVPIFFVALIMLFIRPDGIVPASIEYGRKILAYWRGEEAISDEDTTPLHAIVEKYRSEIKSLFKSE